MKHTFRFLLLIFLIHSCAGTHGYIQRYQFSTSKDILEQAIRSVLKNNTGFLQPDQITKNTDDSGYMTIFIKLEGDKYGYRIRYYGDEEHWKESKSSEIFIASARVNGIGGINSNESMTEELKAKLLRVFEEHFIDLVIHELKLRSTTD